MPCQSGSPNCEQHYTSIVYLFILFIYAVIANAAALTHALLACLESACLEVVRLLLGRGTDKAKVEQWDAPRHACGEGFPEVC